MSSLLREFLSQYISTEQIYKFYSILDELTVWLNSTKPISDSNIMFLNWDKLDKSKLEDIAGQYKLLVQNGLIKNKAYILDLIKDVILSANADETIKLITIMTIYNMSNKDSFIILDSPDMATIANNEYQFAEVYSFEDMKKEIPNLITQYDPMLKSLISKLDPDLYRCMYLNKDITKDGDYCLLFKKYGKDKVYFGNLVGSRHDNKEMIESDLANYFSYVFHPPTPMDKFELKYNPELTQYQPVHRFNIWNTDYLNSIYGNYDTEYMYSIYGGNGKGADYVGRNKLTFNVPGSSSTPDIYSDKYKIIVLTLPVFGIDGQVFRRNDNVVKTKTGSGDDSNPKSIKEVYRSADFSISSNGKLYINDKSNIYNNYNNLYTAMLVYYFISNLEKL